MIANYIKSLYRNIVRYKFYTFFNVLGLATGFIAALFILLFVHDELSFDSHYQNSERIYRLESAFTVNNDVKSYATFPVPLGPTLKEEIPDIEQMARMHFTGEILMRYQDKQFYEWGIVFADSTLFEIFSHEFISGNPDKCLTESNSIVLTQSMAEKYFGDTDPMGNVISDGDKNSFRVTAIIKDLPLNTHLKYDALISMSTRPDLYDITKASRYWRVELFTYILVNKESNIENIHKKFLDYYVRDMEPLGKRFNVSYEMMSTPIKDTHFRKGLLSERPSGNKSYLVIFSAIAAFILLIVAINYMNMATARASNRAKEVGVRKVVGAEKKQLIGQFLGESLILTFLALLIALFVTWLFLPSFNEFADKNIILGFNSNARIFIEISAIAFFVGLLSGSYPAFYLSAFRPAVVLKGSLSRSGKGSRILRKVLVTIQFFIAVFMIISSLVVSGQLDFIREKDIGYEPEDIVVVQIGDDKLKSQINVYKNEILQNPSVLSATNSFGIPGITPWMRTMKIETEEGMKDESLLYLEADFDFSNTYDLKIRQGRDFSKAMGTDSLEAVLINETAAYKFGWMKDPIGKKIHYGFNQEGAGGRMLKVIGVVDDFHFWSLHNVVEPIIIFIQESPGNLLSIKIRKENREETIQYLEDKWEEFGANYPFKYEFMTDRLEDMYFNDDKTATIIRFGALITIILALLGLLGLSSFVAEQKLKEIGIRKIHGATVLQILLILYKDFVFLFIIAFVVAVPIAWWRLEIWLETEFAYAMEMQRTTFLIGGLLAIFIGTITISFFIVRAAYSNPIKTINYE